MQDCSCCTVTVRPTIHPLNRPPNPWPITFRAMRAIRTAATLALAGGMLLGTTVGPAIAESSKAHDSTASPNGVDETADVTTPDQAQNPAGETPDLPAADWETQAADPSHQGPRSEPDSNTPTTSSGPGRETAESSKATAAAMANTLQLSDSTAEYDAAVKATGQTSAVPTGTPVAVQQRANGTWQTVATTTTTANGSWSLKFAAQRSAALRAVVLGSASASATLKVVPKVRIERSDASVLTRTKVRVGVLPRHYSGAARVIVTPKEGSRIVKTGRVARGSVSKSLALNFVGMAQVSVALQKDAGLDATTTTGRVKSTTRFMSRGDSGPEVRPMLRQLNGLGFHTPTRTNKYNKKVSDVVLAFRKSQGMKRTKTMTRSTWRALVAARALKPRYRKSGTHIEVNKTTQLLMVVRDGDVLGTMHVSTGRTGNTPEGSFRVFQRGGSYLYRFMAFLGNYGLHGYVPVPAYAASAGCVRQPMWAADWTWRKTQMGTEVIVYR